MKQIVTLLALLAFICCTQAIPIQTGWYQNRTVQYYLIDDHPIPKSGSGLAEAKGYRLCYGFRDVQHDNGSVVQVPEYANEYGNGYAQNIVVTNKPGQTGYSPLVQISLIQVSRPGDANKDNHYKDVNQLNMDNLVPDPDGEYSTTELIFIYDISQLEGTKPPRYHVNQGGEIFTAVNYRSGTNSQTDIYIFPDEEESRAVFNRVPGVSFYSPITVVHSCTMKSGNTYVAKDIFSVEIVNQVADCEIIDEDYALNVIVHVDAAEPDSASMIGMSYLALVVVCALSVLF